MSQSISYGSLDQLLEQELAQLEGAFCFAAGTRIATPAGPVAVETLRPGDTVASVLRGTAQVVWTGHRRVACRRRAAGRADALPVRVRAGAFADAVPARDLVLSPDHAVYAEGVLIPVRYLINGETIAPLDVDIVTYWHVELDRHDVLLAEDLPAESFLAIDRHAGFPQSAGRGGALAAAYAVRAWEAEGCAELMVTGPRVDRVRTRLAARAV